MRIPTRLPPPARNMAHQSKASKEALMQKLKMQNSPKVLKAKLNTLENFVKRLDAVTNPSLNIIRKRRETMAEIKLLKQQLGYAESKNKRAADAKKTPDQLRQEEETRKIEESKKATGKKPVGSSSFTAYIPSTSGRPAGTGSEPSGYNSRGQAVR